VRSFLAANSFDTAFLLNKKIFQFCYKDAKHTGETKKLLAAAYNSNGIYYTETCSLDSALSAYKKALQLASSCIDRRYIDIAINVADIFTRKGDYINGIGYYRQALFTSDSLGITSKMGFPIYFGLGQAYCSGLRDFDLSEKYFELAWRFYPQRTFHEQFVYCNNRGNSYYYQEKYDRALPWFLRAKALVSSGKYASYENLCYANLSDIYLKLGKLDSAQYYWNKSFRFFASAKGTTICYYLATVRAGIALKARNIAEAHSWLTANRTTSQIEPEIVGLRNQCWQEYYLKVGDYKNAYNYFFTKYAFERFDQK
jgi:tetratricopeptide (TPR) repeat protein